MSSLLEVEDLCFAYPDQTCALSGVSFSLARGRHLAVLGEIGSGRSTLVMALNGVVPQVSGGTLTGRVVFDGVDLADYRVQTISAHVGVVLEDPDHQLVSSTVAADVAFGPANHLVAPEEIQRRVAAALAAVDLGSQGQRGLDELSGGERQRVAVAGILALRPGLLCLDEAGTQLDPVGRELLAQVIKDLLDDGVGVVSVASTVAEALSADELLVLGGGRVCWRGRPGDYARDPDLVRSHGLEPPALVRVAEPLVRAGIIPATAITLEFSAAEELLRGLGDPGPAPVPEGAAADAGSIEFRQVSFAYPNGRQALSEVDLRWGLGRRIGVVGANGAGKSTLIRLLNGSLRPTSGTLLIDGSDTAEVPAWELAVRVAVCFQNPHHQLFRRTVLAEVESGLRGSGRSRAQRIERSHQVLAGLGLDAVSGWHPLDLAPGQRRLVCLAAALARQPMVLVVDEPTVGLDAAGRRTLTRVLDDLNRGGTTVIMVSHDLDLMASWADDLVALAAGRVRCQGGVDEVFAPGLGAGIGTPAVVALQQAVWPDRPVHRDPAGLGDRLVAAAT